MSKIIKSLLILTILSVASCEYWQCGSTGKYQCTKDQTCCRSNYYSVNYSCFFGAEGVCCSDGKNFCPKGSTCNVKESRCDNTPVSFLQELEFYDETSQYSQPQMVITDLENAINFTEGFFQGTAVFWGLEHQSGCVNTQEAQNVANAILDIVATLKSISTQSSFADIFKQLYQDVEVVYQNIDSEFTSCQTWKAELQQTAEKIRAHLSSDKFTEQVTQHALLNIGGFTERVRKGVEAFKADDYLTSGNGFGDLIHFLLFWDFKI